VAAQRASIPAVEAMGLGFSELIFRTSPGDIHSFRRSPYHVLPSLVEWI
jgi:hypothetical protein